ncbi:uncharacterized protein Bfra_007956 [Botrytis fragariae]|uniref:Uncharacterized protein n=1 Tax=Botrytis fragariae TaxID=1964551 RepID=A0A8H6EGF9_9HELO|nr:uncharacterized protein Bfra_007956 [Botrytis fragariae]KAF5871439.1 hypothetical protein Bfra_007956 [Botrytis fragariae]
MAVAKVPDADSLLASLEQYINRSSFGVDIDKTRNLLQRYQVPVIEFEIKDLDTTAGVVTDNPYNILQMHPRKEMLSAES